MPGQDLASNAELPLRSTRIAILSRLLKGARRVFANFHT